MGVQICALGHKIVLPIYSGILPSCVYCKDLAKEYSGYEEEDFGDTEDDLECLDSEKDESSADR